MAMATQSVKALLTNMVAATEREVMEAFAGLEGVKPVISKTGQYVFLPGKRKDRVLLVAHADTVHDDRRLTNLLWIGDVLTRRPEYSTNSYGGGGWNSGALGGDDRAGCAMMYNLWDGQHSVLITTGEERGCIGARAAVREIAGLLEKHQFAVQVDRRGDRQCVFYDVGTKPFKDFIVSACTGHDYEKVSWREEQGSSTDIRVICPEVGICGVNLSAGFYHEHSSDEMLLLGAWLHTRTVLRRLLKQEALAAFPLERPRARWSRESRFHEQTTNTASPGHSQSSTTSRTGTGTKVASVGAKENTELYQSYCRQAASDIPVKKRNKIVKKMKDDVKERRLTVTQYALIIAKMYTDEMCKLNNHYKTGRDEALKGLEGLIKILREYEQQGPVTLLDGSTRTYLICKKCGHVGSFCICDKSDLITHETRVPDPHDAIEPHKGEGKCVNCGEWQSECICREIALMGGEGNNEGNYLLVRPPSIDETGHCTRCGVADAQIPTNHMRHCPLFWKGLDQLNAHVKGQKPLGYPPTVKPLAHEKGKLAICYHECPDCEAEKKTPQWRHFHSGSKCPYAHNCICPEHGFAVRGNVEKWEEELNKSFELDEARGYHHSRYHICKAQDQLNQEDRIEKSKAADDKALATLHDQFLGGENPDMSVVA